MSGHIIVVDFAQCMRKPVEPLAASIPVPLAAMPATAALADIVVRLRTGAREAEAALHQMRVGSAELVRLSADMTQHSGELAGQLGVFTSALGTFGGMLDRLRTARQSA